MSQELPIILAFYDLSVLLLQRVIAFPKNPRYGLGRSIEHRTETILALLIQAKYALRRDKDPFLRDVNVELEILRFQIRQATDLRAISMNQQHAIIEKLIVVGQQVGGWRKSVLFQLAEVAVPRNLFAAILNRIGRLRLAGGSGVRFVAFAKSICPSCSAIAEGSRCASRAVFDGSGADNRLGR